MAWALLLVNAAVVLALAGLRYPGEARQLVSPLPLAATSWWWVVAALACAGAAIGVAGVRRRRRSLAPLLELALLFGLLPLLRWSLPAAGAGGRELAAAAALVSLLGWLLWRDRRRFAELGLGRRGFAAAAVRLALPCLALCLLPAGLVARYGVGLCWRRLLPALAVYPLLAVPALLLCLVFVVDRLRRSAAPALTLTLVTAALCALAQWPNGPLMVLCFVAMAVLTALHLRWPSLWASALALGLLAALTIHLPPRGLLQDGRSAAPYVERLLAREASFAPLLATLASSSYYRAWGATPQSWARAVHRHLLGREPTPRELARMLAEAGRASRLATVRTLFRGPALRLRDQIPAPIEGAGAADLVRRLYRGIVGRDPGEAELEGAVERLRGGWLVPWLDDLTASLEATLRRNALAADWQVDSLYASLLRRAPTRGELAVGRRLLVARGTRGLALALVYSPAAEDLVARRHNQPEPSPPDPCGSWAGGAGGVPPGAR